MNLQLVREQEEPYLLPFPIKSADYYQAMTWLDQGENASTTIHEANTPHEWLNNVMRDQPVSRQTLDELKYIGDCLESFTPDETMLFEAAVAIHPVEIIPTLIDRIGNLEHYFYLPAATHEELGKYLVESGVLSFPDEVKRYLNYEAIGVDYQTDHRVFHAAFGLIAHDGKLNTYRYNCNVADRFPHFRGGAVFRASLGSDKLRDLYITNLIALPADDVQLHRACQMLGVATIAECNVVDMEMPDGLEEFIPRGSLEEFNELARLLKGLPVSAYKTAVAAMEIEQPESLSHAIQIAQRPSEYELLPDIACAEWYADHCLGKLRFSEDFSEVTDFIDREKYGLYKMEEDGVRNTSQGWLIRKKEPFPPPTQEEQLDMGVDFAQGWMHP